MERSDTLKTGLVWGEGTNEIWAGVSWETKHAEQQTIQEVKILIQTTKTNGIGSFFLPQDRKLAKVELRDANGVLIEALPGKRPDTVLTNEILIKDLPHTPTYGHHSGMPKNGLQLSPNIPEEFWDFSIQDTYHIENEGDYTLKIVVGLYRTTSFDGKSVVRMDLPPVTVHMRLTPSPKIDDSKK
jgi:hypothetical protein